MQKAKSKKQNNTFKRYYPLALDINAKKCAVIGAGNVAFQKIKKLRNYGANIFVIAPAIKSLEIKNLAKKGEINFIQDSYQKKYLKNAILVIAATDDKKLNAKIKKDAAEEKALVNVVDDKKLCQFICPAIIEKNRLQIAITTHGQNAKKSRQTRETLEKNFFAKNKIIKIGTRSSPLALAQVNEFINAFQKIKPNQAFEIITFHTKGDYDKKNPIEQVDFYKTLEAALLEGKIDIALHSAKDIDEKVEKNNLEKLQVLALSPSIDKREALVSQNNYTLKTLPKNAKIGASGKRRMEQIKKIRPDIQTVRIRGNIGERLNLIKEKKLAGIIVAMAALKRLGLSFLASEIISQKIMPPHKLQGRLAIEIRRKDKQTKKILIKPLKKMLYEVL